MRYNMPQLTRHLVVLDKIVGEEPGRIAIIGAGHGTEARYLLSRKPSAELFLVDRWVKVARYTGSGYRFGGYSNDDWADALYTLIERLHPYYGRYHLIQLDSTIAARAFPDRYLDYVMLDANVSYEGYTQDLEDWYRTTNVICGRSYDVPKVRRAVDSFAIRNGLEVEPLDRAMWRYKGKKDVVT